MCNFSILTAFPKLQLSITRQQREEKKSILEHSFQVSLSVCFTLRFLSLIIPIGLTRIWLTFPSTLRLSLISPCRPSSHCREELELCCLHPSALNPMTVTYRSSTSSSGSRQRWHQKLLKHLFHFYKWPCNLENIQFFSVSQWWGFNHILPYTTNPRGHATKADVEQKEERTLSSPVIRWVNPARWETPSASF